MNGYHYGLTDHVKLKKLADKKEGFDFNTKHIDFEELEKFSLKYFDEHFHSKNIDKFDIKYVSNVEPTLLSIGDAIVNSDEMKNIGIPEESKMSSTNNPGRLEIIRTDEDREKFFDLNELAQEIYYDKENGDIRLYELYKEDRDIRMIDHISEDERTDFDRLIEILGFLSEKKDPAHITVEDENSSHHITTLSDYVAEKEGMTLDEWFSKVKKEIKDRELKEDLDIEFGSRGGR